MPSILPTMKWTLALVLLLLQFKPTQATHVAGYEIWYECINPCTVRVYKKEYMSCNSPIMPTTGNFIFQGSACTPTFASGWDTLSGPMVTPLCPTSSCANITAIREKEIWRDIDICAGTCSPFVIEHSFLGRPNVSNLDFSFNDNYFFRTYPLTVDVSLGCNHSPRFISAPDFFYCGASGVLENPAFDPDGDSLVYSMVTPLNGGGGPSIYQTGFSQSSPWGSSWNLSMDPQTGDISVSGNGNIGAYLLGVLVEEYRNGVKIGQVSREIVVNVGNCPNSTSPTLAEDSLSPIVTTTATRHYQLQAGQEICFDIVGEDLGDSLFLKWGAEIAGANFVEVGGSQTDSLYAHDSTRGRFCWMPMTPGSYYFSVVAQDFDCPISNQALRIYTIEVLPGDSVWPGDANNDNVANNFDVLDVGLAGGYTGPARSNPTTNWIGQYADPWSQLFPNGENTKYADCDGNGVVNPQDIQAIGLNYGLTHNKTSGGGGSGIPLYLQFTVDSAQVGDTIDVKVMCGDSLMPVDSLYGLAFTVNYDNSLVDTNSLVMTFDNSWLGSPNDLMSLNMDFWSNAKTEAAETRYDHTFRSGMGEIANISIVLIDNIDGKRNINAETLRMSLSDVRIIRADGSEISPTLSGDSMVVWEPLITSSPEPQNNGLRIYPNPAEDVLTLEIPEEVTRISLLDLTGRALLAEAVDGNRVNWDLSSVASGVYFVRAEGPQTHSIQKLIIK